MLALYKAKKNQLKTQQEERLAFYRSIQEKSQFLVQHLKDAKEPSLYQRTETQVVAAKHLNTLSETNQILQQKIQAALDKPTNTLMLNPISNLFDQLQEALNKFKQEFQGFHPGRDKDLLKTVIEEISRLVNEECHTVSESMLKPEQKELLNLALQSFISQVKILFSSSSPTCFISYAWGNPVDETWVRQQLAVHLKQAGVDIQLDVIDNAQLGSSLPDFITEIHRCYYVLLIGTPEYQQKAEKPEGSVGRQEYEMIWNKYKVAPQQVIKILKTGTAESSFPATLGGSSRVYANMVSVEAYFRVFPQLLEALFENSIGQSVDDKQAFRHIVEEYQKTLATIVNATPPPSLHAELRQGDPS